MFPPNSRGVPRLGLDAQRTAIANCAKAEGLQIIGEHTESEPGKGVDALERGPRLAAALKTARKALVLFSFQFSCIRN